MAKKIITPGDQFSRWTVVRSHEPDKRGRPVWWCRCVCGTERGVSANGLKTGNTKSCGCLKRERTSAARKTHGMSQTIEYKTWLSIKKRCKNPGHVHFSKYGGKGIRLCDRWQSFENFYKDMGDRPEGKFSIERRDNSKDYCPENCYWMPQILQPRNRSSNWHIEAFGKTQLLCDWSRESGIDYRTITNRIRLNNWCAECAVSLQPRQGTCTHR